MDGNLRMDCLRACFAFAAMWAGVAVAQEDVLIRAPKPVEGSVEPLDLELTADADVLFIRDDEPKNDEAKPDGYWLGVQIAELPEVAKQQLGIEHGLTVEDVMPESPAAKAEIKKFDILVRAGDTPLKEAGDLVKSVDASQGKELTITVVRGGKDRKVVVTAAKRPEKERWTINVPQPEVQVEIKQLEDALESLKKKAGDGGLGLWFARPAVVAPKLEYRITGPAARGPKGEFPKDLSVQINKQGGQPTKIHVKRGDQEWNITEDKQGISLKELPDDIRQHVQSMLSGMPGSGRAATAVRAVRVNPEGKVEGELKIAPIPPAPPALPAVPRYPARVAPTPAAPAAPAAPQATRAFSFRAERGDDEGDSKLDAILKKLDKLESGTLEKLDKEVKRLREELDELRTKSPGDKK
jgi:membrane-associated protease RseP (regulator of RpoE activity)